MLHRSETWTFTAGADDYDATRIYREGMAPPGVLSGVVNATYTALILDVIGRGARSAGAQYTWLNNLGNLPVAYMTWLDGQGHRLWGPTGLFAVDGIGNVIPILLLFLTVARSGVAKMSDRTQAAAVDPDLKELLGRERVLNE